MNSVVRIRVFWPDADPGSDKARILNLARIRFFRRVGSGSFFRCSKIEPGSRSVVLRVGSGFFHEGWGFPIKDGYGSG